MSCQPLLSLAEKQGTGGKYLLRIKEHQPVERPKVPQVGVMGGQGFQPRERVGLRLGRSWMRR